MAALGYLPDSELHEIATAELAVAGEVEQHEVLSPARELQPNADRPDFLAREGALRSDQFALIPGSNPDNGLLRVLGLNDKVPQDC